MIQKNKSSICFQGGWLLLLIVLLYAPVLNSAPVDVRELPSSEQVAYEEPLGNLNIYDIGFATMDIPSKNSTIRSWKLHVSEPKGNQVAASGNELEEIINEIRLYLGNELVDDRAEPLIKTYDHFLSDQRRSELTSSGIYIDTIRGLIYYLPFKADGYNIQILGMKGSFVSVFLKFEQDSIDWQEKITELFPTVNFSEMTRDDTLYTKTCFDNYWHSPGKEIKTGYRKSSDGKEFYGLRVNINISALNKE